jgi:hypothetical protein
MDTAIGVDVLAATGLVVLVLLASLVGRMLQRRQPSAACPSRLPGDLFLACELERGHRGMHYTRATTVRWSDDTAACTRPPQGWYCTRGLGHEGPCAAHPIAPRLWS